MKRNQGAVLLLALLGLTTISVLAGAFVQMGVYEQRFSEKNQDSVQAFYLSESALDSGLSWLRGQLIPPTWTDRRVLPGGWRTLGRGVFLTTIDPDDNNPVSGVKRFTIEGWGASGTVASPLAARQTRMVVQTESFAQYAYFTNSELAPSGVPVWFVTGDRIEGPTHTNGQFRMYGRPEFQGPVSSVARNFIAWGGSGHTQPIFKETPKFGVAPKKYPTSMPPEIPQSARSGGTVFKGDTSVTLLANGTMRVTNSQQGLTNKVMQLPKNGVLYVDGGTLSLQGTLSGQLTVASSADIRLEGSVTYASDPRRNPQSKDVLGIVAGKNVVIPQSSPHDMQIHGSIMAIDSAFGVENWWDRSNAKGKLTIYGGLIQKNRGPVGSFDPSTGRILSGYQKDYHYDPRLGGLSPPAFPNTGDYKTLVWQEDSS